MKVQEKLEIILSLLESVHLDDRRRYTVKTTTDKGEVTRLVNREDYLELILEATIGDIMNLLDQLEGRTHQKIH